MTMPYAVPHPMTHAQVLLDERILFENPRGDADLFARDLSRSPFSEVAKVAGACATFMMEAHNDEHARLAACVVDVAAARFPDLSWRGGAGCASPKNHWWQTRMGQIVPQAGELSSAEVQRMAQSRNPANQDRAADAWRKEAMEKLQVKDDAAASDRLGYILSLRKGVMPGFESLSVFPFRASNANYDVRSRFNGFGKGRLYGKGYLVLVECRLFLTRAQGEDLPRPYVAATYA